MEEILDHLGENFDQSYTDIFGGKPLFSEPKPKLSPEDEAALELGRAIQAAMSESGLTVKDLEQAFEVLGVVTRAIQVAVPSDTSLEARMHNAKYVWQREHTPSWTRDESLRGNGAQLRIDDMRDREARSDHERREEVRAARGTPGRAWSDLANQDLAAAMGHDIDLAYGIGPVAAGDIFEPTDGFRPHSSASLGPRDGHVDAGVGLDYRDDQLSEAEQVEALMDLVEAQVAAVPSPAEDEDSDLTFDEFMRWASSWDYSGIRLSKKMAETGYSDPASMADALIARFGREAVSEWLQEPDHRRIAVQRFSEAFAAAFAEKLTADEPDKYGATHYAWLCRESTRARAYAVYFALREKTGSQPGNPHAKIWAALVAASNSEAAVALRAIAGDVDAPYAPPSEDSLSLHPGVWFAICSGVLAQLPDLTPDRLRRYVAMTNGGLEYASLALNMQSVTANSATQQALELLGQCFGRDGRLDVTRARKLGITVPTSE